MASFVRREEGFTHVLHHKCCWSLELYWSKGSDYLSIMPVEVSIMVNINVLIIVSYCFYCHLTQSCMEGNLYNKYSFKMLFNKWKGLIVDRDFYLTVLTGASIVRALWQSDVKLFAKVNSESLRRKDFELCGFSANMLFFIKLKGSWGNPCLQLI